MGCIKHCDSWESQHISSTGSQDFAKRHMFGYISHLQQTHWTVFVAPGSNIVPGPRKKQNHLSVDPSWCCISVCTSSYLPLYLCSAQRLFDHPFCFGWFMIPSIFTTPGCALSMHFSWTWGFSNGVHSMCSFHFIGFVGLYQTYRYARYPIFQVATVGQSKHPNSTGFWESQKP